MPTADCVHGGDYGGERVSRDCDVLDIDDWTGPWVDVRRWIDEQVC